MSDRPDWYDEKKVTKAVFAIERGRPVYTGWVVDLGDGTCRFSNAPLLGEHGPQYGDRVDLFYNPCKPLDMPWVGYRIYKDGEEPVGRHFALKREPDEEERAELEEEEKAETAEECRRMKEHLDALMAPSRALQAEMKTADEIIRYEQLLSFVKEKGIEIPADLHTKKRVQHAPTPEERKSTKLFLLSSARADYADIEVTEAEIQAEVSLMRTGESDDDE